LREEGDISACENLPEGYGKFVYQFDGAKGSPKFCGEVQSAFAYTFGGVSITKNRHSEPEAGHTFL